MNSVLSAIKSAEQKRDTVLKTVTSLILPPLAVVVFDYLSTVFDDFERYLLERLVQFKANADYASGVLKLCELTEAAKQHPLAVEYLKLVSEIEMDSYDIHGATPEEVLEMQLDSHLKCWRGQCARIKCHPWFPDFKCSCWDPLIIYPEDESAPKRPRITTASLSPPPCSPV